MTITDEDVYAYLEHHGVKGMRWGSRKAAPGPTGRQPTGQQAVNAELARRKRNDRIATGLAVGAIGLLVANQILARNRKKQLKAISLETTRKQAERAGQLFGAYKKTPMSQVVRTGFAVNPSGSASPIFKRVVGR